MLFTNINYDILFLQCKRYKIQKIRELFSAFQSWNEGERSEGEKGCQILYTYTYIVSLAY